MILSICLVLSGILLIIACVGIYNSGDEPFTRESISKAFASISIPICLSLAAIIVGAIFKIIFPSEKEKPKAKISEKVTLSRLEKRLCKNRDKAIVTELKKIKNLILALRLSAIALSIFCAIPSLIFIGNVENFTLETNESILAAFLTILPWMLITASISIEYSYTESALIKKQISVLKNADLPKNSNKKEECGCCQRKRASAKLIARFVVLTVAIGLIIAGILNGGMADVLEKAVNICTECIGLG